MGRIHTNTEREKREAHTPGIPLTPGIIIRKGVHTKKQEQPPRDPRE
jgi:hypothetical protein